VGTSLCVSKNQGVGLGSPLPVSVSPLLCGGVSSRGGVCVLFLGASRWVPWSVLGSGCLCVVPWCVPLGALVRAW